MVRIVSLALGFFIYTAAFARAEEAQSLQKAKEMSARSGKPILMKFFKEG